MHIKIAIFAQIFNSRIKMIKYTSHLLFIALFIFGLNCLSAQEDPILFSVEGNPVHLSEFQYIYNKNNGKEANYLEASVKEYLDLYVKFKLKVQKAKDMKLDTIVALQKELEGYRKQLANSYLTDKEVMETLIKEAYDRQSNDVHVKHILLNVNEKAPEHSVAAIQDRANKIHARLVKGESFEKLANTLSNDRNSANKGGDIGYINAMLPNGFYDVENAVYTLKKGEFSEPVRSKLGFHIIKRLDSRPSRGEMEVAHILLRKKKNGKPVPNVKNQIDSIYSDLLGGASFGEAAKTYSDDKASKMKGGVIGTFGINRYEKSFEDVAFAIENDGEIAEPVESTIGWHIIKRISKAPKLEYDKAKRKLQARIMKDSRFEIAKQSMIERIKGDAKFKENNGGLDNFISMLDESFYSYQWKVPNLMDEVLFQFGPMNKYSSSDFAEYCKKNNRVRLRMDKTAPIDQSVRDMYATYVNEKALAYEEQNLENKYPEFKSLMREYDEGILLFEATKIIVWDKAGTDTIGLNAFYEKHKNDYEWKERATVHNYTVNSLDEKLIKKIRKYAKRKSPADVLQKFNATDSTLVQYTQNVYERGHKELAGYKFKKKSLSLVEKNERKKQVEFKKIASIQARTLKTMREARGYIVADYQDYLEKQWVNKLRNSYDIKINDEVLNSIIKK